MTGAGCQSPRLLDPMRAVLRVPRYALRTERAYGDWVRRYVKFHGLRGRADLQPGTGQGGGLFDAPGGGGPGGAGDHGGGRARLSLGGSGGGGQRRRMAAATGRRRRHARGRGTGGA